MLTLSALVAARTTAHELVGADGETGAAVAARVGRARVHEQLTVLARVARLAVASEGLIVVDGKAGAEVAAQVD